MTEKNICQQDFLTLAEAADYMRCSVDSLRAAVANHNVPFVPRPDDPLFFKPHLREFLLSNEIEPDAEVSPNPTEANIGTTLLKRLIERSGLVPRFTRKYVNLSKRKGSRVLAQLHENRCGVHLVIPEGSKDETLLQSPVKRADIEELAGYSIGPEKDWLLGNGHRGTYKPAIAFHVPNTIVDDSDAWHHVEQILDYAINRPEQPSST